MRKNICTIIYIVLAALLLCCCAKKEEIVIDQSGPEPESETRTIVIENETEPETEPETVETDEREEHDGMIQSYLIVGKQSRCQTKCLPFLPAPSLCSEYPLIDTGMYTLGQIPIHLSSIAYTRRHLMFDLRNPLLALFL